MFGSYLINQKEGPNNNRLTLGLNNIYTLETGSDMGIKWIRKLQGIYILADNNLRLLLPETNRGESYKVYANLEIVEKEGGTNLLPTNEVSESQFYFFKQEYPLLVVCVTDKCGTNNFSNSITTNNVYMALQQKTDTQEIEIINDKNKERHYPAFLFSKI